MVPAFRSTVLLLSLVSTAQPKGLPSATPTAMTVAQIEAAGRQQVHARVTLRAMVTRQRPGSSLFVRDGTGSLYIDTEATEPLVDPGDVVEITGVTAMGDFAPYLDQATFRKVSSGPPPAASHPSLDALASGAHEAELVTAEGVLERVDATRYEDAYILRNGPREFTAWVLRVREHGSRPAIGSRLSVTGVVSTRVDHGQPVGFELLLRDDADCIVLAQPSVWTPRRLAYAGAASAILIVALLSYVVLLRRQVDRQTATIRRQLKSEADLLEQYRQAQKIEAIGRLAGGIAHDFNNIMTVVLGYSEVLAHECAGQPALMESIDEIQRAAERATLLTRQLLAFGRRQRLEAAPVDLNAVVTDMAALFARVLGGDIKVEAVTAPVPVVIVADRGQLDQALLNLALNSRDAMPDGGRLTLRVICAEHQDPPAGEIVVEDTGAGIPADAQPHVFEPFFSTKEVGQGSGMGLAMVYGFVQQSGGRIAFESRPGRTAFTLAFPVVAHA